MYYLRKISRGKWPGESLIAQATLIDIQADTVISELKTDNNKLSIWKIESETDLEDAFIALASNCQNIGTIFAVKILPEDLRSVQLNNEEGSTPTIGINHKHCNIINLNYISLGYVITSILNCIKNEDSRVVKKSRADIKRLLLTAYSNNKLNIKDMSPSVLKDIGVPFP